MQQEADVLGLNRYCQKLESELRQHKLHNPVVVARALHLWRFNLSATERVQRWFVKRFPLKGLPDAVDLLDWVPRFQNVEVPEDMEPWSLMALVECAIERYGDEAARTHGACGFYTLEQLLEKDGFEEFGGDWTPEKMDE